MPFIDPNDYASAVDYAEAKRQEYMVEHPNGVLPPYSATFGQWKREWECRLTTRLNLTANDAQEGGSHYKDKTIQPWDYITMNNLGYLEGNIVKYVSRWKDKNGIEDLKKARHYLDKLIEISSA